MLKLSRGTWARPVRQLQAAATAMATAAAAAAAAAASVAMQAVEAPVVVVAIGRVAAALPAALGMTFSRLMQHLPYHQDKTTGE